MKKYLSLAVIIVFVVVACIYAAMHPYRAVENTQPSLPVYSNGEIQFSVTLPEEGYIIDESYVRFVSPDKNIKGVSFTIPQSMATGTNLSTDSYISVESIPNSSVCTADMFVYGADGSTEKVEDGIKYSLTEVKDAAAGNRYEQTIYALPYNNSCVAIRYLIHYGVFENYPEGSRVEFNKEEIISQFDVIRKSLVFY